MSHRPNSEQLTTPTPSPVNEPPTTADDIYTPLDPLETLPPASIVDDTASRKSGGDAVTSQSEETPSSRQPAEDSGRH